MNIYVKRALFILGIVAAFLIALFVNIDALSSQATLALAILVCSIFWWISGIFPEYVIALIMAALFIVVANVPTATVFSSFATSTWWLLVSAFGLGVGMQASGLMKRMANAILQKFPKTFKAQSAGLMACGTIIGPLIPSLSAKAVILAPLSMGISDSMGYARKSKQADGLFLAMFTGLRNIGPAVISASIIGYGLVGLLPEDVAAQFDMVHWFLAMLPWFLIVTVLNYIAIVAIFSPKKKDGEGDCSASFKKAGDCGGGSSGQGNKLVQDSSTPSAKKEPLSRQEKQMAVIICACILLWIFEPLTGIESHVVAVCAFGATLICGIVDKAAMRAKIAWDSLIFIGIVLGLANVFAYLGIDTWIVESCAPLFSALASNPYLFILGIGVTTVILRFVIVSEMAYINLFMAFMVPLAVNFGISPWVVGVCVYAMVNPWFVLYQNPIYLSAYYATDAKMVNHSTMAKYCLLYLTICQCALLASVPYWQFLGIL